METTFDESVNRAIQRAQDRMRRPRPLAEFEVGLRDGVRGVGVLANPDFTHCRVFKVMAHLCVMPSERMPSDSFERTAPVNAGQHIRFVLFGEGVIFAIHQDEVSYVRKLTRKDDATDV